MDDRRRGALRYLRMKKASPLSRNSGAYGARGTYSSCPFEGLVRGTCVRQSRCRPGSFFRRGSGVVCGPYGEPTQNCAHRDVDVENAHGAAFGLSASCGTMGRCMSQCQFIPHNHATSAAKAAASTLVECRHLPCPTTKVSSGNHAGPAIVERAWPAHHALKYAAAPPRKKGSIILVEGFGFVLLKWKSRLCLHPSFQASCPSPPGEYGLTSSDNPLCCTPLKARIPILKNA